MTYRWRYFALPRLDGLLDLLLLDSRNPRSLLFQLARVQEHAFNLPDGVNAEGVAEVRHRTATLESRLATLDQSVLADPEHAAETRLLLASCTQELSSLSELLTQVYFSHVQPRLN